MVEVARAEQFDRLRGKLAMLGEDIGRNDEFLGAVGDGVEGDALAKVVGAEIFAREYRRIDQRVIADDAIVDSARGRGRGRAKCGRGLPPGGDGQAGADRDLPHEIAGRVKRHRVPLDVRHFARDDHAALVIGGWRQVGEARLDRGRPGGNVEMEGEDVDRVAAPFQFLPTGEEAHAGKLVDLPARRMIAGEPFGQQ